MVPRATHALMNTNPSRPALHSRLSDVPCGHMRYKDSWTENRQLLLTVHSKIPHPVQAVGVGGNALLLVRTASIRSMLSSDHAQECEQEREEVHVLLHVLLMARFTCCNVQTWDNTDGQSQFVGSA